jgi:uncharacterized protein YndB with AHSA1/START domain
MTTSMTQQSALPQPDPTRDLVLERVVDVPSDRVWAAWTTPALLTRWFTPAPWTTVDCELDLRPGGIFRTVMRSPEGQEFDNAGCILEVVPGERLAWTAALAPGFRPRSRAETEGAPFHFTAELTFAPHPDGGTTYTARAIHADEEGRAAHERMGFHAGWGAALDQLVALVRAT